MKIQPVQTSTQYSQAENHSVQTGRNDPSQDLLIYAGGDDSGAAIPAGASSSGVLSASRPLIGESNVKGEGISNDLGAEFTGNFTSVFVSTNSDLAGCNPAGIADSGGFWNLFDAIADFFWELLCCPVDFIENLFGKNRIDPVDYLDNGVWNLNLKNISIVSKPLVLPKDRELAKISLKDIRNFIKPCLVGTHEWKKVKKAICHLKNLDADPHWPILLKYLRAIVHKFQTENLPQDKKQEVCVRLGQAMCVCEPTWVQVAKTICEEFYLGSNNVKVEETLLQLIEQYKSELLVEEFEKVSHKLFRNDDEFDWNIISMVRNKYGKKLGLDRSSSQHDPYHTGIPEAIYCAEQVMDAYLKQYKDVNRLVAGIQDRIIAKKIDFFDYLVQLIEKKNGLGNADAKTYVIEHLFDKNEDATVFTIRPEAVYLMLQSIHIVI